MMSSKFKGWGRWAYHATWEMHRQELWTVSFRISLEQLLTFLSSTQDMGINKLNCASFQRPSRGIYMCSTVFVCPRFPRSREERLISGEECCIGFLCSEPDLFILQIGLKKQSEQQNSQTSHRSARGQAAKCPSHLSSATSCSLPSPNMTQSKIRPRNLSDLLRAGIFGNTEKQALTVCEV